MLFILSEKICLLVSSITILLSNFASQIKLKINKSEIKLSISLFCPDKLIVKFLSNVLNLLPVNKNAFPMQSQ